MSISVDLSVCSIMRFLGIWPQPKQWDITLSTDIGFFLEALEDEGLLLRIWTEILSSFVVSWKEAVWECGQERGKIRTPRVELVFKHQDLDVLQQEQPLETSGADLEEMTSSTVSSTFSFSFFPSFPLTFHLSFLLAPCPLSPFSVTVTHGECPSSLAWHTSLFLKQPQLITLINVFFLSLSLLQSPGGLFSYISSAGLFFLDHWTSCHVSIPL